LPKISISGDYELKRVFLQLGIRDVFTAWADLSKFTGSHNLKVSKANPQPSMTSFSHCRDEHFTVEMSFPFKVPCDRLCLFLKLFLVNVFDRLTGSTLFLEKVVNLTEK
uniref:Serpin domain-containing protein n=1 Tax=Ornithorhynchus anatinus TaxID=9258 RepID=A0A6I8P6B6_ORNAN